MKTLSLQGGGKGRCQFEFCPVTLILTTSASTPHPDSPVPSSVVNQDAQYFHILQDDEMESTSSSDAGSDYALFSVNKSIEDTVVEKEQRCASRSEKAHRTVQYQSNQEDQCARKVNYIM